MTNLASWVISRLEVELIYRISSRNKMDLDQLPWNRYIQRSPVLSFQLLFITRKLIYFSHSPWKNVQLRIFVWNILMETCLVIVTMIKRALDKYNIILQLSPKRVEIFVLSEVLACVMTACWILHSSLIYFWRNMHISEKVYFKSQILVRENWTILDHFCVPVL